MLGICLLFSGCSRESSRPVSRAPSLLARTRVHWEWGCKDAGGAGEEERAVREIHLLAEDLFERTPSLDFLKEEDFSISARKLSWLSCFEV